MNSNGEGRSGEAFFSLGPLPIASAWRSWRPCPSSRSLLRLSAVFRCSLLAFVLLPCRPSVLRSECFFKSERNVFLEYLVLWNHCLM